jgi:perosamine synthetase
MIITNDEQLAMNSRKVGGHGFKNLRATEGRVRLRQDVFQNPHYKRHDVLGWNYRLSEFNAAIALAQLEKHEELIDLRIKSANMFLEVMHQADYLVPQVTPHGYENSYYTLGVKYEGKEQIGVSWEQFRTKYIELGGDGIYGAWAVPYLEPMVSSGQYIYRNSSIYKDLEYKKGLCPVAEAIQPKIMQFKTNYRNLELCREKADALSKTIEYFKK